MDIYCRISETVKMNRLSHAYIIAGEENDALDLGLYIARACNCISVDKKPCGQCLPCRKINKSNHPDVSMIRVEGSTIGIDIIRQLQKDIYVKSYEGNKKIYIIVDGEKMTVQAQNCLLKVLEDPPGTGIIIITSSNYQKLIPTVLSRCQILKLNSQRELKNHHLFKDLMICFMKEDFVKTSARIDQLIKEKDKWAGEFLDFLLIALRDILIIKATKREDLLYFKEYENITVKTASRISYNGIDRIFNSITRAGEALKNNANLQLTMEVLSLEMQEVLLC